MTRFLILGEDGMVGSGVCAALAGRHHVEGTRRSYCRAGDIRSLHRAIEIAAPDVVVNCIGIVPQRSTDAEQMIEANALFPHQLRSAWSGPLIHISTDCVFDQSIYGRTKLLGETGMTLRCCVTGFSPKRRVSLLDWFVFAAPAEVDGWRNAYFAPVTNLELGRAVERAAEHYEEGVFNVAGARLSKYDYLHVVNAEFRLGKSIRAVDEPRVDKSTSAERFMRLTGWCPMATGAQVRELRA